MKKVVMLRGGLKFDGVDDKIIINYNSYLRAVILLCIPNNISKVLYDARADNNSNKHNFALYNENNSVAYSRLNEGYTYINGNEKNTKIQCEDINNKKQCIILSDDKPGFINFTTPVIGSGTGNLGYFSNLILYKFLGFKESLTEKQIKAVINKYNLLDGVDTIN